MITLFVFSKSFLSFTLTVHVHVTLIETKQKQFVKAYKREII